MSKMIFVNRFLASKHLDADRSHARCLAPFGLALQRAAVCDEKAFRPRAIAKRLLSWTLVISMPRSPAPETKPGFPTKQACEQAAAKWRANFETQVKEGTIRTDTDRRRRLARAIPSTKCVEDTKIPSANP